MGNKGPLKALNGTKLILDGHGNNLDSFRTSNWSGTIFGRFLQQTGSSAFKILLFNEVLPIESDRQQNTHLVQVLNAQKIQRKEVTSSIVSSLPPHS